MRFFAQPGQEISINRRDFRFTFHPSARNMAYAQSARRSTVYQIEDISKEKSDPSRLFAFKVFNRVYRNPYIANSAGKLSRYASFPGLEVCRRYVITEKTEPKLLDKYADFQYSVIMPWIEGQIWQTFILGKQPLSQQDSQLYVASFLQSLVSLEDDNSAHCDISGANVMLDRKTKQVKLIDVEEIFGPNLEKPERLPAGTPGYAHKEVSSGIWGKYADRFAAAILMAEILGWHDSRVQRIRSGESYFSPNELQKFCDRYQILLDSIDDHWGADFSDLFARAWFSDSLEECPSFHEWSQAMAIYTNLSTPSPKGVSNTPFPVPSGTSTPLKSTPTSGKSSQVTLEKALERINRFQSQGQWSKTIELCKLAQSLFPDSTELSDIHGHAEDMYDLEKEFNQAKLLADRSESIEDWTTALKIIRSMILMESKLPRYQQEENRIKERISLLLIYDEALTRFEKGEYQIALEKLSSLTGSIKKAAKLHSEIEYQIEIEKDLENYKLEIQQAAEAENWQAVISKAENYLRKEPADAEVNAAFKKAKNEIEKLEKIDRINTALEIAIQNLDWPQALENVDQLIVIQPDNQQNKVKREKIAQLLSYDEHLKQAESAANHFAWEDVLVALADVPDKYQHANILKSKAQARLKWREDIQSAKTNYDIGRIGLLLQQTPASPDEAHLLKNWYEREENFRTQLTDALIHFDVDKIESLLKDLPDKYPNRKEILAWHQREKALRKKVEEAKRTFDLDQLSQILSTCPKNHPLKIKHGTWLASQLSAIRSIEQKISNQDINGLSELIEALPNGFPQKAHYQESVAELEKTLEEIETLKSNYAFKEIEVVIERLPSESIMRSDLEAWLDREHKRQNHLKSTMAAYQLEAVKKLSENVNEHHPDYEQIQSWLAEETSLREKIMKAISGFDLSKAKTIQEKLPADHTWQSELSRWITLQETILQKLQSACEESNLQTVDKTLKELNLSTTPEIYQPYIQWVAEEKTLRKDVQSLIMSNNLQKICTALPELPENHPIIEKLENYVITTFGLESYLDAVKDIIADEISQENWESVLFFSEKALHWTNETAFAYFKSIALNQGNSEVFINEIDKTIKEAMDKENPARSLSVIEEAFHFTANDPLIDAYLNKQISEIHTLAESLHQNGNHKAVLEAYEIILGRLMASHPLELAFDGFSDLQESNETEKNPDEAQTDFRQDETEIIEETITTGEENE